MSGVHIEQIEYDGWLLRGRRVVTLKREERRIQRPGMERETVLRWIVRREGCDPSGEYSMLGVALAHAFHEAE